MKKRNIIAFPKMRNVEYIEDNGFLFQWCCDCGLRHIWNFQIVETKKQKYVKIIGIDDILATKLRKFYKKYEK